MNRMRRVVRAFTLIEMLTVIAIIGILAAILIPVVRTVQMKARIVTASADVSHLAQAATAYSLDFGGYPPDQPFDSSNPANYFDPLPRNLNPNEMLMWYLTMQYSAGQYNTASSSYPATGYPIGYPGTDSAGDWNPAPASASVVFSRGVNAGPYFDMKTRQKADRNGNGFWEFNDPWGRPYMYHAYTLPISGATVTNVSGNTVTLRLTNPAGYGSSIASRLFNTNGSIQLSGFSQASFNGTFTFQGTPYDSGSNPNGDEVNVTTSNPPSNGSSGSYTFPLHNRQTCDIYSLGPYGRTRAAGMPANGEWKPTHAGNPKDNTSLDVWPQVWGTPGDGNDINSTGGNTLNNPKDQDDISNW